ncbi:MAG: hypothetical protein COB26_13035 [Piscirickettsiaceae bacterium]|nr:MAG: hypothetical protein COB26_13035 [Piscirickettsiaceae bacterium]
MKALLRKACLPILRVFESGEEAYAYQSSHRKILLVVGGLFLFLSIISAVAAVYASQPGAFIPFTVFFLVGLVCEIVGLLGNDRAVAKIWGSK